MVLANLDRHQLVHMSLSCWRGPDNRRRPPVRAVLLGNRQTTLIGERTISRRGGMPFCMVHGAPLLGDMRGAPLHRDPPCRPVRTARSSVAKGQGLNYRMLTRRPHQEHYPPPRRRNPTRALLPKGRISPDARLLTGGSRFPVLSPSLK
jgi:hypothetical protein